MVDVDIFLRGKKCEIALQVVTDYKRYEADDWESELVKKFPVEFSQVQFEKFLAAKGRPSEEMIIIDSKNSIASNSKVKVEYRKSKEFEHNCYIVITPKDFGGKIKGHITFDVFDPRVRGSLEIKEID